MVINSNSSICWLVFIFMNNHFIFSKTDELSFHFARASAFKSRYCLNATKRGMLHLLSSTTDALVTKTMASHSVFWMILIQVAWVVNAGMYNIDIDWKYVI